MPTVADPFGVVADRGVYLPDADALVVADLHLGLAVASAVDVPLAEGEAMVARLVALVDRFEPATVVLAGDTLHAFGHVPRAARDALEAIRSAVRDRGATLVAIEGNHDVQLSALTGDEPVEVHELPDGSVVCHGHEVPDTDGRRYLVGHDHPAIDIEGRRRPCYLFGPSIYGGTDVLALPAFNPSLAGTAVNDWADGDALSPLLAASSRCRPIVLDPAGGGPIRFPPLAELQPFL